MRARLFLPGFVLLVAALVPTVPDRVRAQESDLVRLADAFPGVTFSRPLFALQPPDATDRMFVIEQGGKVFIVPHPAPAEGPIPRVEFLDVDVERGGNEQGLLGFAFHPQYASNGLFYVNYSRDGDGATIVSEFSVSAGNPDQANAGSERVLMTVAQPYSNHNGGMIAFGPDDMLYISLGDGGSGGDPQDNGENLGTLLGGLLRIDVDDQDPDLQYAVPPDNPFVARQGARRELWAYGLRNLWRFSFDRSTGECWGGDVGQNAFEEVDLISAGDNLGWDRREGFVAFEGDGGAPVDPFVDPLHVYGRNLGRSITGGYVYRGDLIPELVGQYLFADYVTGRMWQLAHDNGGNVQVDQLLSTGESVASFVEDRDGELYICTFGGRILAILPTDVPEPPPPPEALPELLSQTPLFRRIDKHRKARGALRYGVRSELWADFAEKDRWIVLPPRGVMTTNGEDSFDVPVGTWIAKTFRLGPRKTRRALETRVILYGEERFLFGTYKWRADGSDADLVHERETETVQGPQSPQEWTYPSPEDCLECHTEASSRVLGITATQVKARRGRRGVMRRWRSKGVLDGDGTDVPHFLPVAGRKKHDRRVRSYLASNCAYCHRPGAPEPAGLDLRASVPLADTGLLDLPERSVPAIPDARVVFAGDPDKSVLLSRMALRGDAEQMPKLGSAFAHETALDLVEGWIRDLE